MEPINYTIIGLITVIVNLGGKVAEATAANIFPRKSVLTVSERDKLTSLHELHQAKDPNTGIPLWYVPIPHQEAVIKASESLIVVSERLGQLVDMMSQDRADRREEFKVIVAKLDDIKESQG